MSTDYKPYDYAHYSLGSKPKLTLETIDQSIAKILELINNNPDISEEQLRFIDQKIKEKLAKKESAYLLPTTKPPATRKITFAEGTKEGGKFKRTRRHKKQRKSRRHRHRRR